MNYHKFFLDNIKEDSYVLDIGCGNGALTYDIGKKARKVVGIDLNHEYIKLANKKYSRENIIYITGDATKELPNEKFDFIVLSNILEHIENRTEFLNSIIHLAPVFLIRVPMIDRDWLTLYKKELGLNYLLDSSHFIEYTFDSFRMEIAKANLSIMFHFTNYGELWAVIKNDSWTQNE